MSMTTAQTDQGGDALNRLVNREEVLQICYWYQGEGFGDVYNAAALESFLNCDAEAIDFALKELEADGCLKPVSGPTPGYRFTDKGKKLGGSENLLQPRPSRPRYMHAQTYQRLLREEEAAWQAYASA